MLPLCMSCLLLLLKSGFCVLRCDPTSTFTFTTGVKQRSSADSACSGDGKTLAKLDSQMIVDSAIAFISGYGGSDDVFIGALYDGAQYVWDDGSELIYTNWMAGQPDPLAGECVVALRSLNLQWSMTSCSTKTGVLCMSPCVLVNLTTPELPTTTTTSRVTTTTVQVSTTTTQTTTSTTPIPATVGTTAAPRGQITTSTIDSTTSSHLTTSVSLTTGNITTSPLTTPQPGTALHDTTTQSGGTTQSGATTQHRTTTQQGTGSQNNNSTITGSTWISSTSISQTMSTSNSKASASSTGEITTTSTKLVTATTSTNSASEPAPGNTNDSTASTASAATGYANITSISTDSAVTTTAGNASAISTMPTQTLVPTTSTTTVGSQTVSEPSPTTSNVSQTITSQNQSTTEDTLGITTQNPSDRNTSPIETITQLLAATTTTIQPTTAQSTTTIQPTTTTEPMTTRKKFILAKDVTLPPMFEKPLVETDGRARSMLEAIGIEVDKSQGNSPVDLRPSSISIGSTAAIILTVLIVAVIVVDSEGCYRAVRFRGVFNVHHAEKESVHSIARKLCCPCCYSEELPDFMKPKLVRKIKPKKAKLRVVNELKGRSQPFEDSDLEEECLQESPISMLHRRWSATDGFCLLPLRITPSDGTDTLTTSDTSLISSRPPSVPPGVPYSPPIRAPKVRTVIYSKPRISAGGTGEVVPVTLPTIVSSKYMARRYSTIGPKVDTRRITWKSVSRRIRQMEALNQPSWK